MPNQSNRTKLTKTVIAGLEPKDKEYAVWDSDCPGFAVRVLPTGTKSFFVSYRDTRRKTRRKSLGSTLAVDVAPARREARNALADIDRGVNPFAERQRLNQIPELRSFWPVFLCEHAEPTKAKRSVEGDRSLWKNWLEPEFGKLPLNEIRRSQISAWHKRKSDRPIAANRALALLSRILTFAIEYEYIESNPCFKVRRHPESARQMTLSKMDCLRLIEAFDADADKGAAIIAKLLLLTGARRGELLKARWSEFDLEEGLWVVPSENIKGGVRRRIEIRRSLSTSALSLLKGWHTQSLNSDGLVFPSHRGHGQPRYDLKKFWGRVRKRTGFSEIRMHDLRHAFASLAIDAGMSLDKVGLEMGHRSTQTTRRYANLVKRREQTAADLVAASLSGQRLLNARI